MADLPKPKVAIMDLRSERIRDRAFPKHAAVCVTIGLWERLDPKEREAHELCSASRTATRP